MRIRGPAIYYRHTIRLVGDVQLLKSPALAGDFAKDKPRAPLRAVRPTVLGRDRLVSASLPSCSDAAGDDGQPHGLAA